jgi:hypothetical protein
MSAPVSAAEIGKSSKVKVTMARFGAAANGEAERHCVMRRLILAAMERFG